jgi:hypothetical protein
MRQGAGLGKQGEWSLHMTRNASVHASTIQLHPPPFTRICSDASRQHNPRHRMCFHSGLHQNIDGV